MSSAGISFGGLGSGLDTQAIISALMAVERRPLGALEAKKTSYNRQKGLFDDLKGLLEKLDTAAKKLSRSSDLLSMSASSSNEDILTVSAGSNARPGSHEVEVVQLANAKMSALGRADLTDTFTGTFFIDINGVTKGVSVDGADLNGVAEAINSVAATEDLGINADVVDTGITGPDRFKLVVRSDEVGLENAFTLTSDGDPSIDTLVNDLNAGQINAGQDARVKYNGIEVARPTNSISDLIPGVTINLKAGPVDPATITEKVTISINTDAEATAETLQEFVDSYNAIVDFVSSQNAVSDEGQARNPLFGDPTLRSLRSNLRSIVGGAVDVGNPAFSMLAMVGIESDRDGKLTLNRSTFEEKLAEDEQAVAALFSSEGTGIATRITAQLDIYTDSVEGLIKTRQEGFDRLIKDATRQIDQTEGRLERTEASLQQRYANLESLLARLQGQGSSLQTFSFGQ